MATLSIDKSNWELVRLGDVAHEVRESLTKSDVQVDRSVGLEHIEPGDLHIRTWDELDESSSFTKVFREGHVLFGRRRAYLKKAALADFNGVCSGDITVISANEDLLPSLLPFVVSSDRFFAFAVEHSAGGLSPRVKWKDLANYEFLLPPKDQQAEIAELLWALDESLQQHSFLEKCIQSLRQASAKEVGKFAFRKWQDELPANWTLKTIGQIGQVQAGTTPLRRNPEFYNDGDIPWVKTLDLTDEIIQSTEEAITDLAIENTSCKIRPEGTVLVAMYGGFNQIGRSGVLGFKAATNQAVCGIELDRNEVLPNFLNVILKSNRIYWRSVAISSRKDPNITKDDVLRFRVPLPPINVQEEVVTKDLELRETCIRANAKYATLSVLRRAIIEDIFCDV